MIALVFIACLQSSPDICREQQLLYAEAMTPMRCLMEAQPHLAQWRNAHPDWRVARWRCGRPSQFAQKA